MRFCATIVFALLVIGTAVAIAPPQDPNIIPTPPTTPLTPIGPPVPPPVPEPSSLTIVVLSAAAAGSLRLLRRK
jgi:hypothetical protein